jgi:hypothetical protein
MSCTLSTDGSVATIESLCSEGCPVAPSILYDQRALLYETRKYFRGRKAVTAYHNGKGGDKVGEGSCLRQDESVDQRKFPRSLTFRHSRRQRRQGMISTNL